MVSPALVGAYRVEAASQTGSLAIAAVTMGAR